MAIFSQLTKERNDLDSHIVDLMKVMLNKLE